MKYAEMSCRSLSDTSIRIFRFLRGSKADCENLIFAVLPEIRGRGILSVKYAEVFCRSLSDTSVWIFRFLRGSKAGCENLIFAVLLEIRERGIFLALRADYT
jgi:hypothetical protein